MEEAAEAVLFFVGTAEFGGEADGGALGSRGGIVELVGEVGGELSECEKLFGLLVHTGEVAGAIEEESYNALTDGWDGLQHRGKEILMEIENPEIADGITICSPALHAGVRKFSGKLCGTANEEGDRRRFAAVDLG